MPADTYSKELEIFSGLIPMNMFWTNKKSNYINQLETPAFLKEKLKCVEVFFATIK